MDEIDTSILQIELEKAIFGDKAAEETEELSEEKKTEMSKQNDFLGEHSLRVQFSFFSRVLYFFPFQLLLLHQD